MPENNERVQYYGVWRMRIRRLALAACCVSFTTVTSIPAPAAANGIMAPICTASGAIIYIFMSFDDEDAPPPPDGPMAACHGPCLHERKRPLTEK